MAHTHDTGKQGENLAIEYLRNKGYQILETNWQSNHQEIDIIAQKGNFLVIAEVKTRRSNYFGDPETSVTRQKQKMIIKAANHYISLHKKDLEVRFDILSVLFSGDKHTINHIEAAFYPLIS